MCLARRIRTATGIAGLLVAAGAAQAEPCVSSPNEGSTAKQIPDFLNAWVDKYPTSTLPARAAATTGSECFMCHHPPTLDVPGNCYRQALIALLGDGKSIEEAIDQLDAVDSDGDDVSNGDEATWPRPESGEVGYNMGLLGSTGTDPCAPDPDEPVTGMSETPPAIPAVSAWGLLVLATAMVGAGSLLAARRQRRFVPNSVALPPR